MSRETLPTAPFNPNGALFSELPPDYQKTVISKLEHPAPTAPDFRGQIEDAMEAAEGHPSAPPDNEQPLARPAGEHKLSIRERFFHTRLGRKLGALAFIGLASGGVVATEAVPAAADSGLVYTVVNPDNDGTRKIYDRNSPNWGDSNRKLPDASYYGDRLELICATNGEAVGPYSNRRWHYAENLTHPEAGRTWIPDRLSRYPQQS